MFTFIKPLSIKSFCKVLLARSQIFSLVRESVHSMLGVPHSDIISVIELPAIASDKLARTSNLVADAIIWMNTSDHELVKELGEILREKIQNEWALNKKLKNISIEIWIGDFQIWGYVGLPIPKTE